jgi:hypothetical protein
MQLLITRIRLNSIQINLIALTFLLQSDIISRHNFVDVNNLFAKQILDPNQSRTDFDRIFWKFY